jgi:hypothetical protein
MINEKLTGKDMERSFASICLDKLRNLTKTPVRIDYLRAEF